MKRRKTRVSNNSKRIKREIDPNINSNIKVEEVNFDHSLSECDNIDITLKQEGKKISFFFNYNQQVLITTAFRIKF